MATDRVAGEVARRRLLAGVAAGLAGAGGCLSSGTASPEEARITTRPDDALELSFGTEFSENGIRARPLDVAVQRSFHVRGTADVHAADGRQFLFLEVVTGNSPGIDPPLPEHFAVDVGGDRHQGWIAHPDVEGDPVPDDFEAPYTKSESTGGEETEIYGGEGHRGWIGFDLPASVPGDPDLVLQRTEAGRPVAVWPLPTETVERLGAPAPSLSVPEVSLPESVPAGEAVTAAATAENAGDGDATFRVALVADGGSPTLAGTPVPAGETRTWEGSVPVPGGADTVEVAVRTAPRDVTREVRVE